MRGTPTRDRVVTAEPVAEAARRAASARAAWTRRPPPLMVVTDFDGTLSRDPPRPARRADRAPRARRPAPAVRASAALYPTACACSCSAAAPRSTSPHASGSGGLTYLGNHGLEGGALPAARPGGAPHRRARSSACPRSPTGSRARARRRSAAGPTRPGCSSRTRAPPSRSTSGQRPKTARRRVGWSTRR